MGKDSAPVKPRQQIAMGQNSQSLWRVRTAWNGGGRLHRPWCHDEEHGLDIRRSVGTGRVFGKGEQICFQRKSSHAGCGLKNLNMLRGIQGEAGV